MNGLTYGEVGQFIPCTIIPIGTKRDERDGQNLYVKSISWFGQFNMPGAVETYQLYIALIRVTSTYVPSLQQTEAGADITAVDLSKGMIWDYSLDSLTTPNLFYNWLRLLRKDATKEFQVITAKWYRFNRYERNVLNIHKKVYLNKKITYTDSDTTGESVQGQYYLFIQSDKQKASAGGCYFHIVTKFKG